MGEPQPDLDVDEQAGDMTPMPTPEEPEYDTERDLITDTEMTDPVAILMVTLREHYKLLASKPWYRFLGKIKGYWKIRRIKRQIFIAHYRRQFPMLQQHTELEMAIMGMENGGAEESLLGVSKVIGGVSDEKKSRWRKKKDK